MSMLKVVGTGPLNEIAARLLCPFGTIAVAPNSSEEALLPLMPDAVALVVRGDGIANARVIGAAPHLKVIGRTGAGYNNVDIAAATARGIPVVYTPGVGARAVAEAALALMLALCKRLVFWDQQLKAGNWRSRNEHETRDLDGATLGIVGFGAIGRLVAELARPFNMTLLAYDPYASAPQATELGVKLVSMDELMAESDFISLHAPATAETHGLINRERLKLLKPGSYLVNLGRGQLVESPAVLHEALVDGRLAGVALDVFDPEPPDLSHPIFKHPNCLTSPHALGMTRGAMARIFRSMAEDMAAVLSGGKPRFVVNSETLQHQGGVKQALSRFPSPGELAPIYGRSDSPESKLHTISSGGWKSRALEPIAKV